MLRPVHILGGVGGASLIATGVSELLWASKAPKPWLAAMAGLAQVLRDPLRSSSRMLPR